MLSGLNVYLWEFAPVIATGHGLAEHLVRTDVMCRLCVWYASVIEERGSSGSCKISFFSLVLSRAVYARSMQAQVYIYTYMYVNIHV